jgi:CBS domain containing-hemolysin-like protein
VFTPDGKTHWVGGGIEKDSSTAGLVTIEDLVEELVGDIFGEHESPKDALHIEADGSALVPGWLPIRKVNRTLDTALPIARESTTIAGLCMAIALSVPSVGTKLSAPDGTLLEVVDASPRRAAWFVCGGTRLPAMRSHKTWLRVDGVQRRSSPA